MAPQHSSGYAPRAWPTMTAHAAFSILIIPESLAEVSLSTIAQDSHDVAEPPFGRQLRGDPHARRHVPPRRGAHRPPFFARQPPCHPLRFFGLDENRTVRHPRIVNPRAPQRRF